MADTHDPAVADKPASSPTNDKQFEAHRRTFDGMLGMFKWLIIAVAFILLGMLVFLR